MEHKCDKCLKIFDKKQHLVNHLKRKYPCIPDSLLLSDISKLATDLFACKLCGIVFNDNTALSRHIHNTCSNSPYVKEKEVTGAITDSQDVLQMTTCTNSTVMFKPVYNINIVIDGHTLTEEDLKHLDLSKPENIKYLVKTFGGLQNAFGKETTEDIEDEKFITIYKKEPLLAFKLYLRLIYEHPKNKNISIFNINKKQISLIDKSLRVIKHAVGKAEMQRQLETIILLDLEN